MRQPKPFAIMVILAAGLSCGCRSSEAGRQALAPREGSSHGDHHGGTGGPAHHHRPQGRALEDYIAKMESPERAAWQMPDKVLATLKLRRGERVADVGAGPGYFTLRIARAVGATQKVWAVDVEPKMLERLRDSARRAGIDNIECVLAPPDAPSLPQGQVDTIFIVDTFHHFPDRRAYVAKLKKALASGGRIVIIDFVPKPRQERGFGPPLRMQLSRDTVDADLASANLFPAAVHDFLPEQYFVEYRAAAGER